MRRTCGPTPSVWGLCAFALAVLASCAAPPAAAPTAAWSPAPADTARPASTSTATLTPAPTDTLAPTETAAATPLPTVGAGSVMLARADGRPMVFVPAGPFPMGAAADDADADADEAPGREVTLDGFWIDQYEVTNADYARCVEAGACGPPAHTDTPAQAGYYGRGEFARYPVVNVNWQAAADYCAWAAKRLPTEAEWEKAARGNQARPYPWGAGPVAAANANLCDAACAQDWRDAAIRDGYGEAAPVGSYPAGASPYGAHDMAGNVWEWVADWFAGYRLADTANPAGPATGGFKIVRGGSWESPDYQLRASNRFPLEPDQVWYDGGFRCAQADDRARLIWPGQAMVTPSPGPTRAATARPAATPSATPAPAPAVSSNSQWLLTIDDPSLQGDAVLGSLHLTGDGGFVLGGGVATPRGMDAWAVRLRRDGSLVWQKAYSWGRMAVATYVAEAAGGFLMFGQTNYLGAYGGFDVLLIGLDAEGGVVWQKIYGGEGNDVLHQVRPVPGGGFVFAGRTETFDHPEAGLQWPASWVGEFNAAGDLLWNTMIFRNGLDRVRSLRIAPDGGLALGGTADNIDVPDAQMYKLDRLGRMVWHKLYGTPGSDQGRGLYPARGGGYYLYGATEANQSGAWLLRLDAGGNILWQKTYGRMNTIHAVHETGDGGILLAGSGALKTGGRSGAWLMKLNPEGSVAWQKIYAGGFDKAQWGAVTELDTGELLVLGTYKAGAHTRTFLAKLAPDGDIPGCRHVAAGGPGDVELADVAATARDGEHAVGVFTVESYTFEQFEGTEAQATGAAATYACVHTP